MDGILLFLRVVLSLAAVFGLLLYLRRKFSARLGTPGGLFRLARDYGDNVAPN